MKNTGFLLNKEIAEQSEKDWLLGGEPVKGIAENIPFAEYLPQGEIQRTAKSDMMDCATRAPLNILETKMSYLVKKGLLSTDNHKWLLDNGYIGEDGSVTLSDAYTAILSGTTTRGNSLKAPLEAIRKYGVIPKSRLPLESWMSWWDFHKKSRVTPIIKELGAEFAKRFPINYEKVMKEDFGNVIPWDMIDVAGYAWSRPDSRGIYPRINATPNHAFAYFKTPAYMIFDNYIDSFDGDFIKHLNSDYNLLHYGYRLIVNEVGHGKKKNMKEQQLEKIYKEILMREPDDGAKSYLNFEEDFVKSEVLKSKERKQIESWVGFLRGLFLIKGK